MAKQFPLVYQHNFLNFPNNMLQCTAPDVEIAIAPVRGLTDVATNSILVNILSEDAWQQTIVTEDVQTVVAKPFPLVYQRDFPIPQTTCCDAQPQMSKSQLPRYEG